MPGGKPGAERELKLRPLDPGLLDALADVGTLDVLKAVGRRRERQRNSYFDTRDRALGSARLAMRRRVVEDEPLATWSLKAEGTVLRGLATRPEVEVTLGADMPPALVLSALSQAARQRGAAALAEQLADAIRGAGGLVLARPFVELETDRRIVDLAHDRAAIELALDRVTLVGHPAYAEHEIEVELKRGGEDVVHAARVAIERLGHVVEGSGTKLARALQHLASCECSD
jgi:inorganic triphosphatase YgiF